MGPLKALVIPFSHPHVLKRLSCSAIKNLTRDKRDKRDMNRLKNYSQRIINSAIIGQLSS